MSQHPVVWFEIGCTKLDGTSKFLSDLFGWKMSDYGGDSHMIDTGVKDTVMGHISSLADAPLPQYVVLYTQVDDVQASLDKAAKLGGKTVVPPTEVPNMGTFAWLTSPEGQIFGLWKPAQM